MGARRSGWRNGAAVLVALGLMVSAGVGSAAATPRGSAAAGGALISLRSTQYGKILAGPSGKTLYDYSTDGKNVSHCDAQCRSFWPPLMTSGAPRAGAGVVASKLGQTSTHQVTYNGHPLYYFVNDSTPGQTAGENVADPGAGTWYVVNAKGNSVK